MAAEKPEVKQIFNSNLLLSFSAGNQSVDAQVNVPFVVKKMVLHPPRHNAAAAAHTDQFLLYSSLNKGAGILGMIDANISGCQTEPITVIFDYPQQMLGYHKFWARCFTEAAGGAVANLTAKVWMHIEFHNML